MPDFKPDTRTTEPHVPGDYKASSFAGVPPLSFPNYSRRREGAGDYQPPSITTHHNSRAGSTQNYDGGRYSEKFQLNIGNKDALLEQKKQEYR